MSQDPTPSPADDKAPAVAEAALRGAMARLRLFQDEGAVLAEAVLPHAELREYAPGDTIVTNGQFDGGTVFGIAEGTARLTQAIHDTGDLDVSTLFEGHFLGLAGSLVPEEATPLPDLSMVALTPLKVILIDASALAEICEKDLEAARVLLRYCAREILRLEAPADEDVSPERRVYRHLLSLVEREAGQFVIEVMPRHATLAEAAGVSERDAAAAVAALMANNIAVREYPRLIIQDMESLRRLG